jgi:SAM-dependent methyltransferase
MKSALIDVRPNNAVQGTGGRGIPADEHRSLDRLRVHYELEKTFAAQLRAAPRERRLHMLTAMYEELFRQIPDHPRLTRKQAPEALRGAVMKQMRLLRRFLRPGITYLEIGPGECAFAFEVAKSVRQVYAVDVDAVLSSNAHPPENFRLFISDGVSIPVPAASVQLAYSNQLMEHLHPEDAHEQLRNIFAALAPGGAYVCVTPNRLNGPHDISRYFSEEAEGFHLKEYTVTELERLLLATGFRRVAAYARIKDRCVRIPVGLIRGLEALLERLPVRQRFALADSPVVRPLLSAALVATR